MNLMRFSCAMVIILCRSLQPSMESMNSKVITCIATIIDEPIHSKVLFSRFCFTFESNLASHQNCINFQNFLDKTVLIIGAGPSGVDLTYSIAEYAKNVIFSHHTHNQNHTYPSNVIRKGSIQKLTQNGAIFTDGSEIDITDIVFCTGRKLHVRNVMDCFSIVNLLSSS